MSWEEQLFSFFDELEGQAEVMFGLEREVEVAERARIDYQQVSFASRLMASLGSEVRIDVTGVGSLYGTLQRVATGWVLLSVQGADWVIPAGSMDAVVGAAERSVPEVAWPAVAKLGLGSACRRIASARVPCVLHLRDGARHELVLQRVGADFVEGVSPSGGAVLVPYAAIAAIRSRD